ncbi:erythromycin esterase family protein [Streptomyces sp. NPDC000594]|uniref:erythromycin esterase family protein n=1 Tax=Streptomyces sp. NPDC000594 TaxID=3154261 RepID=UPI0033291C20
MDFPTTAPLGRRRLTALALTTLLASGAVASPAAARQRRHPPTGPASAPPDTRPAPADPVPALARAAHPLTELRPLERMIRGASIVGLGEATHGSGEFFRVKHRILEHLVERAGFTTFALEANWSTGVRLDDYVVHGRGDLEQIMREEFQSSYTLWNTREYRDLIRWMREHNLRHPRHPVRFMGNDCSYASAALFDTVTRYVADHRPGLLAEVRERYRPWRPTGTVAETVSGLLAAPLAERHRMRDDLAAVAALIERRPDGADPERHSWVRRHARAIAQVGGFYAYDYFDPAQTGPMMRYRDRVMAENTVWWQRRTGGRVLLSAHNGHVGYETVDPERYPKLQGAFLREMVGDRYVSVGFTFGRGSFHAMDLTDPAEPLREFSIRGPEPGSAEETLERVARQDHYLDLRTVPAPAREWLNTYRPVWSIGNSWPERARPARLATGYDILIHLRRVTASRLLPPAGGAPTDRRG